MWSNNKQGDSPNPAAAQPAAYQPPQSSANFNSSPSPAASQSFRSSAPTARNLAILGPGLTVKGQISGEEDLQIDGKVEGPISLKGQRLTVGQNGEIVSDVHAREVIVYGKVRGNITGGRVLIEDGAYLKGQIEIERGKSQKHASAELEPVGAGVGGNS